MSDDPIFPILKEYDWVGKEFSRVRHMLGVDRDPMPLIAYGYSTPDTYNFLTSIDRPDARIEDIHYVALRNLVRAEARWERVSSSTLTGSGYDFSAEKLLCGPFIAQAHELLGAERIEVAAPRRRVIYACSAPPGTPEYTAFSDVVWHTWLDDSYGNAPVSNMIFRFENTRIVGASVLDPEPPGGRAGRAR